MRLSQDAPCFKNTLSEDQVRVFDMLLDLRFQTDWIVRVIAEDHYFKLGCLAGYGKLGQVPELIAEYPKQKSQEIARILREDDGLKKLIDDFSKALSKRKHLQLV